MKWLIFFSTLWVAWVVGEFVLYLASCLRSWLRRPASLSRSSLCFWSSAGSTPTRTSRSATRSRDPQSATYPEES